MCIAMPIIRYSMQWNLGFVKKIELKSVTAIHRCYILNYDSMAP